MDIKMEDQKLPFIKPDPDAPSPASIVDDDAYEDTGELEIPKEAVNAQLFRIPEILYEAWADIDEDEEIELGVLRQYSNTGKFQLLLNRNVKQNAKVPKEYDVDINVRHSRNMFIFSEKDIPGYKNRKKENKPKTPQNPGNPPRIDKYKRFQPYFTRSIPKQTILAAMIKGENTCKAVINSEYEHFMRQRMQTLENKRPQVTFLSDDVRNYGQSTLSQPARAGLTTDFNDFVKSGITPGRPKPQENKAARMPENELLDLLAEGFKKYRFWSLKALRQVYKQPEAYLKSTVDKLAVLVRSGPHAMHYELRPEVKLANEGVKDEAAPGDDALDSDGESLGADDDDDEDLQMEDAM